MRGRGQPVYLDAVASEGVLRVVYVVSGIPSTASVNVCMSLMSYVCGPWN
jgi:hypothetical protein